VTAPILYEINTRCWLRELSDSAGKKITLANIPESELARWQKLGFTHIWLMGVWTTGPRSRAEALKAPDLLAAYRSLLPDWQETDVAGSPYAIGDYRVPPALGGDAGLADFRKRLNKKGFKLVLDFVPNHLGLDHAWLKDDPDLFVQSPHEVPGTFRQETRKGVRWLAHGKDPYFAPWTDTVQLDYRRGETRAAMTRLLQSVADRCDAVRCDMAMLLLNEIFPNTWRHLPCDGVSPSSEFWQEAIAAVKKAHPGFFFLAEAYWNLEWKLQSQGFDCTYDKTLYDRLINRNGVGVQQHLLGVDARYLSASAHFLENHDEPRVAGHLSAEEQRPALLAILGLPGMRFLHEGQLSGARSKIPVQLGRRPIEAPQADIVALYEKMLATLPATVVGKGAAAVLGSREAWPGNPTFGDFVVIQWQERAPEFDLVVVNYAPHRSQCYVPLSVADLAKHDWTMKDLLGTEDYVRAGADLQKLGLYLDLAPWGAQLFHFSPAN
jgi:hypothetical protein